MEAAITKHASPAIACHGLVKRFGDVVAVNGLDLEVAPGECFGLLGPNGAGKTTTIEILEGLTKPDAGEVTVLGRGWGTHERELRARLGISLQESRFPDRLTVFETLDLFRSLYPNGRDPERLVADMSLEEKRDARVGKLSGGQRQRLAVACAL
ncbi:MAG: ABC transporter ATP-binding protein, partial [Thermoanaerobaculia bacterium]